MSAWLSPAAKININHTFVSNYHGRAHSCTQLHTYTHHTHENTHWDTHTHTHTPNACLDKEHTQLTAMQLNGYLLSDCQCGVCICYFQEIKWKRGLPTSMGLPGQNKNVIVHRIQELTVMRDLQLAPPNVLWHLLPFSHSGDSSVSVNLQWTVHML